MTRNTRVDTTLSAIITEAGAFPPEATTPSKDDQRSAVYPLRVYDGYNYLPTYYGYKSYFGLDSVLDATGLAPEVVVEDLFVYQARDYSNILIALTSHGIFMRSGTEWKQLLTLTPPPEGTSIFWSRVILNQLLFIYYQGSPEVYVLEDIIDGAGIYMDVFNGMQATPTRVDSLVGESVQLFSFIPTILNMEGQVGIYAAGGSLGFWDTDDSVSWSAISDYTDFTPSLTTLANLVKLQDQVGRVTTIAPHGDGFVVYCTRSVIYMQATTDSLLRFQSTVILGSVGVTYPREVAVAQPDTTHYAWTSMGLVQIENGKAQPIVPDFSDHVSQTRTPQYLKMLNNRYLCVGVMDPNFIPGNIEQSAVTVDPGNIRFDGIVVPGLTIPGSTIEGNKVCFTVPEYDYTPDWDDPEDQPDPMDPTYPGNPPSETVVESGIKPYHTLQFYGQWLYMGATISTKTVSLGGEDLEAFTITEGSTQARYQNVPVKMELDEIGEFNSTGQLDELETRQLEIYDEKYSDDRLRIQQKWDDYVAARDAAGGFLEELGEITVTVVHPEGPDYEGVRWDNSRLNRQYSWGSWIDDGRLHKGSDGNVYVSSAKSDGHSQFRVRPISALVAAMPSRADWLHDTENYDVKLSAYQALGPIGSLGVTEDITPETSSSYAVFSTYELDTQVTIPYRFENQEYDSLEAPFVLIEPGSLQDHQLVLTGPGLTYKVLPSKAMGVEVAESYAVEPYRILRAVPHKVTYAWEFRPRGVHKSNTYADKDHIIVTTTTRVGRSGDATITTQEFEFPEFQPNVDLEITIPRDLGVAEAYTLLRQKTWDLEDAVAADIAAQEAAYWQSNYVNAYVDDPMPPPGDETTVWRTYSLWWGVSKGDYSFLREVSAEFPGVLVRETQITETAKDLVTELYGEIPPVLPPDKVGATAVRALSEESKRGLISVHQHFYSNNNSKEALDPSFLITAAGRVDVPLGTPLGAPEADAYPSRFTEKANWANRYFVTKFEPIIPEGGWPEGERWPPSSNGHNPLTPFPPTDQRGWEQVQQSVVCGITDPINIPDIEVPPVVYAPWEIENPPLTWVLENGSIAPYNPTLFGAYVYDLHLQKWGVFKGNYKHLVDYQAVNNYSPGAVPYKNFLIDGGCLTEDLEVALFNDYPTDNFIRYGKYQHIGADFCALEEVKVDFRTQSTGLIAVQFSIDGRQLEYGHTVAQWFNQSLSHTLNCDIVGRWASIALTGHYDLSAMQIKSNPSGRR